MSKGYLALILHAHLPFVRHPEDEYFLEERWLYEAITETYIPLILVFERLIADNIPFRFTLSLSPPLISMLTDPLLQSRYSNHLSQMQQLAEKEVQRTKNTEFFSAALMYQEKLQQANNLYNQRYHGNLVAAFKSIQDQGRLEIITCGATHGYLPFMLQKESIHAQVETAVKLHQQHIGCSPKGIWLPECAYCDGVEDILKEYGIKFFMTDTHGILFAEKRPRYGVYAPIICPNGVAAFGRDVESSKQVWSADSGYPGDFDYREYYRDIGYDLEDDYIWEYVHPDGIRHNTGFKYYRITGKVDLADKKPYVPQWAANKVNLHASNFLFNREKQVEYLASVMDRPPIIVSPYDAELFGHWWYEGPSWLEALVRKVNASKKIVQLISPSDYLELHPRNQVTKPCECSWGANGYHQVWLNEKNQWIYRHLQEAAARMVELANRYPASKGLQKKALNQAARELMLAQASDWAFIMHTGTTVEYAVLRTKTHLNNFLRLYEMIKQDAIDQAWLNSIEEKDNIFPQLSYDTFQSH